MIALPAVIGHRGAAALAPENTLASFEAAAAAGAGWVEFDVRLSADAMPLVIHDETVVDPDGVELRIDATPAAALRAAAGANALPGLAEVLDCLADLGMGANVEIKPQGRRRAVCAASLAALAQRPLPGGVIVSSFDLGIVAGIARIDRSVPRGILMRRPYRGAASLARRLGCASIHCEHGGLSPACLARWRDAGLLSLAYTVNQPSRALRLLSWGLDAVITDDPAAILARL